MVDDNNFDPVAAGLEANRKEAEPCTIVIFGASGDLTARKLIPALYHLYVEGQMPESFRVLGFARREKTDESWRAEMREGLEKYSRSQAVDEVQWAQFAANLGYHRGDLTDPAAYTGMAERLKGYDDPQLSNNLVFYLAISPSLFGEVVDHLHEAKLLERAEEEDEFWQRVVVEKPFGHDLESAHVLNNHLLRHARERQIFRIDHYLGKETVQNIMMFRFSNAIFEQLWNRETIEHIQITVSEDIGVGSRGGYFEEAGTMRDMMQNHLLQILSLVAMEPPPTLAAEDVRNEKVKALKSIRAMTPENVAKQVVRGQYFAGTVNGDNRAGYRQEDRVNPESNVETYVALKLFIDNWRWSGVPFYLRTGKNLPMRASEVRVQFRPTPNVLFAAWLPFFPRPSCRWIRRLPCPVGRPDSTIAWHPGATVGSPRRGLVWHPVLWAVLDHRPWLGRRRQSVGRSRRGLVVRLFRRPGPPRPFVGPGWRLAERPRRQLRPRGCQFVRLVGPPDRPRLAWPWRRLAMIRPWQMCRLERPAERLPSCPLPPLEFFVPHHSTRPSWFPVPSRAVGFPPYRERRQPVALDLRGAEGWRVMVVSGPQRVVPEPRQNPQGPAGNFPRWLRRCSAVPPAFAGCS